jgi:hypothetical protein
MLYTPLASRFTMPVLSAREVPTARNLLGLSKTRSMMFESRKFIVPIKFFFCSSIDCLQEHDRFVCVLN